MKHEVIFHTLCGCTRTIRFNGELLDILGISLTSSRFAPYTAIGYVSVYLPTGRKFKRDIQHTPHNEIEIHYWEVPEPPPTLIHPKKELEMLRTELKRQRDCMRVISSILSINIEQLEKSLRGV